MKKYIIEIASINKPSYYIRGSGDPSRTTIPYSAQMYDYIESANRAMKRLATKYPNREFKVRTVIIKMEFLKGE